MSESKAQKRDLRFRLLDAKLYALRFACQRSC